MAPILVHFRPKKGRKGKKLWKMVSQTRLGVPTDQARPPCQVSRKSEKLRKSHQIVPTHGVTRAQEGVPP